MIDDLGTRERLREVGKLCLGNVLILPKNRATATVRRAVAGRELRGYDQGR